MNRIFIPTIALVFCCMFSGAAFAQRPGTNARVVFPPPPPPPPANVQLEPGDVITSVNGRPIRRLSDFTQAVDRSGPVLRFTVRDARTGRNIQLATQLDRRGHRFGVVVAEQGRHRNGVVIQQVFRNSAAERCWRDGGPGHHPGGPHYPGGGIAVRSETAI